MATLTATPTLDTQTVTTMLSKMLKDSFVALGTPGNLMNTDITAVQAEPDANGFTLHYNTQCITSQNWEKNQSLFLPMEAAQSLVTERQATWVGSKAVNEMILF